MVRLYMDENVDGNITRGLRERGVDVLTVQEDGKSGISDPQVMDRAMELGRVVFTNDEDLLIEANKRQQEGAVFSGVIYIHKMKFVIGQCISDLELVALAAGLDELLNRVQYLPL